MTEAGGLVSTETVRYLGYEVKHYIWDSIKTKSIKWNFER